MWRHLPNAISIARIAATPVLAWTLVDPQPRLFRWLLLVCYLSDIADGMIARAFNLRSALGAMLDSIADTLVQFAAVAGLFIFEAEFLHAHAATFWGLLALFVALHVGALARYGKLASFHTWLMRAAAYAQGIFLVSLFFWGYYAFWFHVAVGIVFMALLEELALLILFPVWTTDVGGLVQVLGGTSKGRTE